LFRPLITIILFAVWATGCTTPRLPDEREISASEIIQRVKCELHDAIAPQISTHPWLGNWAAGFTLTLQVKDSGSASASTDWIVPIPLGAFTFKINGGISETARRTASFKLSLLFNEAVRYVCPLDEPQRRTGRNLTGELGLKEWIDRMVEAVDLSKTDGQFNGMGYTIEFILSFNAAISQSWAIVRKSGKKYDPSLGVGVGEDRTNTLDIALVKIPPSSAPPGPQHVIVDNIVDLRSTAPESRAPSRPQPSRPSSARPVQIPTRPSGVDPDTQRRLDSILQDLQLRNLQVR
jgi:hypothetical protein